MTGEPFHAVVLIPGDRIGPDMRRLTALVLEVTGHEGLRMEAHGT